MDKRTDIPEYDLGDLAKVSEGMSMDSMSRFNEVYSRVIHHDRVELEKDGRRLTLVGERVEVDLAARCLMANLGYMVADTVPFTNFELSPRQPEHMSLLERLQCSVYDFTDMLHEAVDMGPVNHGVFGGVAVRTPPKTYLTMAKGFNKTDKFKTIKRSRN